MLSLPETQLQYIKFRHYIILSLNRFKQIRLFKVIYAGKSKYEKLLLMYYC